LILTNIKNKIVLLLLLLSGENKGLRVVLKLSTKFEIKTVRVENIINN